MPSLVDQKQERRNSSSGSSLPPTTPPSPAFPSSKSADRTIQKSSLPPVSPSSEISLLRAPSPLPSTLPRSRSSSRVFDVDKQQNTEQQTVSVSAQTTAKANNASQDGRLHDETMTTFKQQPHVVVDDPIHDILMTEVSSSSSSLSKLQRRQQQSSDYHLCSPPIVCCCFYAEFDNVVGPKVAFQSPPQFMDQDMNISESEMQTILEETLERLAGENSDNDDGRTKGTAEMSTNDPCKSACSSDHDGPSNAVSSSSSDDADDNDNGSQQEQQDEEEAMDFLSIFDATNEYIITGPNELAGKMINLSTHNMHVLTRPTAISDAERYERNALLFSVGFVLSRNQDPKPFRPLLSKLANALESMEVESRFLTDPTLRWKLQSILDRLLVALNSPQWECNLLLDSANALNLRAFRPPKPPASPVPDYAVPLLVREDLLDLYDWDLAIKWIVSKFITGVDHARWIAIKSDVDMEMVRACLRVLKHHGVIALVDMFFYTNRYEFTQRASAMLAGKEPELLQEAVDYVSHQHHQQRSHTTTPPFGEAIPAVTLANLSTSLGRHSDVPFLPINEDGMSVSPTRNSNSGLPFGSIPSIRGEVSKSTTSKCLHQRTKRALAELYCSCSRNMPFGELLVSKVEESSSVTKRNNVHASSNEDSSLDFDDVQQEPLGKDRVARLSSVSDSECSVSRSKNLLRDSESIDWKEAFEVFDHRRFAIFGVVHGLLRRVHNFPRAVEALAAHNEYFVERTEEQDVISDKPTGSSSEKGDFRRAEEGSPSLLASRIAAMMDGTKCDDELVCEFEKPIDELIERVETTGRKVMCIYA